MSGRSGALTPGAELAESVLARATTDDAIVIVEDRFDADVRFANNTTTTNGVRRDRRVSVIAITDRPSGRSVGIASGSGPVDVDELLARATVLARDGDAAEDAMPLVSGIVDGGYTDAPVPTGLSVFGTMLDELAEGFSRAPGGGLEARGVRESRGLDGLPRVLRRNAPTPCPADRIVRARRPVERRAPLGMGRKGHARLRRHLDHRDRT